MSLIKAIVIGKYGIYLESLINKLKKEACEVFVITGNKSKSAEKHSGIVEEYNFEYDNPNIHYILESTKAEVVIFTGALDPHFSWKEQRDAVAYIAGLDNILISAEKAGVKRFIYVSSIDVYDKGQGVTVTEDFPANPVELRTITIKGGEDISLRYDRENGMQVVLLRYSEVYGFVAGKINGQSLCTKLCMETLKGETPYIDSNQKHDYIHVSDSTEVVYQIMDREKLPHCIYNICSGNGITERQTLELLTHLLDKDQEVKYLKDSSDSEEEYSNNLAVNELGFNLKYSFEEGFGQMAKQLQISELFDETGNRKGHYFNRLTKNLQTIFGWFFPYFETILTFIVIQAIVVFSNGSSIVEAVDFYLLYVVFIAIIYGKGQTITALLLSLTGKVIVLGQFASLLDVAVDYNTYLWMLQLLIIGMGIGYIRDRYKQAIDDKGDAIKYLEAELSEIKEINHSNIRIKKIFENRLINYQDSFARIYSIVTKLDELEPDKIMFSAVDVVSRIMGSKDVVIYSVDKGSNYARLTAGMADSSYAAPKSIELDSLQEIYEEIQKHKIYINRTIDNNIPSMAGGIYHEDTLESVIMIWSLPFENTTLYHINLFSVVLNLIAQAMHRANLYIEESRLTRYINGTSILTQKSFQKLMEIKKTGSDNNLAEFYILKITDTETSFKNLNDVIVPMLRQHDYLGVGEDEGLYLLLTNTNEDEAEFVIQRLVKKGIDTRKEVNEIHGK